MQLRLQIVSIAATLALFVVVFELVRRRRLMERYALLWLFSTVILLGLALWEQLLEGGGVVIGSSASPGLRDFAIAAAIVADRQTSDAVSFDVNPTSREILQDLTKMGATFQL